MKSLNRPAALMLAALVSCALGACKKQESAKNSAPREVVRYTVRGVVEQMPDTAHPDAPFRVHHEAIPEFRRTDGALGMNTMTMEFPLSDGVSLEGIAPGDKVTMTFETEYADGYTRLKGYSVVEITELPPDTTLDFSTLPKPE